MYRQCDCCVNPPLFLLHTIPPGCCILYGLTEQRLGMNNCCLAALKCAICMPFGSCCWVMGPTRTVIREAQEVPGTTTTDHIVQACCCCLSPFMLYQNAYAMSMDWLPKEFEMDGLDLQRMHDPVEQKIHLD